VRVSAVVRRARGATESKVLPRAPRRQLSLSTNQIDRMFPLANMGKLKILSLSRNLIKKIEKLEEVAGTLEVRAPCVVAHAWRGTCVRVPAHLPAHSRALARRSCGYLTTRL
jgi:Leucine-rich repeat (LRR) protein